MERLCFMSCGGFFLRGRGVENRCGRTRVLSVSSSSSSRRTTVQMQNTISRQKTFQIKKPLGIILEELKDGNVFIASLEADSNAATAGLVRGDVVLGVEGKDYTNKGLETVMEAVKAASGDEVNVLVERTIAVEGEKKLDPKMTQRLRKEVSAPYRQNWLGIAVVIVLVLIVLSSLAGIKG